MNSTRGSKGIGVIALSIALVVGLGGLGSAMAAKTAAPAAPAHSAGAVLDGLMASGQFASLSTAEVLDKIAAQGVAVPAEGTDARTVLVADINARRMIAVRGTALEGIDLSTGIGKNRANPIVIQPRKRTVTIGGSKTEWTFDQNGEQARSGYYPLPNSDSLRIYSYENDFVFRSRPSTRAGSDMMDIITFGGTCPVPPEGIYSFENLFEVYGAQPNGLRRIIRVWNNWNGNVGPGMVVSNLLGEINDDFGFTPNGLFYLEYITLATPIFPTHNDNIGIEWKYVDNVTGALTSTTEWFASGPPIGPTDTPNGPPASGSGPPTGTSANFFYRDQNLNGLLETQEALLFSTSNPQIFANVNQHLGGFPPSGEIEANNTQATANASCICGNRTGDITPAGDQDWWKFKVDSAGKVKIEVLCPPGSDVTVALRNSGGGLEGSADDHGLDGTCNETIISPQLSVGDHAIEIHEKGDNGTVAYTLKITPLADLVSNMEFDPDKVGFRWDSQAGGSLYDVMRGNIESLSTSGGDFSSTSVVTECWDINLTSPVSADPSTPGGPSDSYFYISRAKNTCGGIGSWDEGGNQSGLRDAEIAANPNACP